MKPLRALRAPLLHWYRANKRSLPWRGTRDPYLVLVSELMLQQTRVATVIPYFHRFVERFANFEQLAHAELEDVLRAWSGLGYYRRAKNLHLCAQEVTQRHQGEFPLSRMEAVQLPGVGRYTAGAVLSIAYDQPEPIVDGNVARVLSRVRAIEHRLGTSVSQQSLWQIASELVKGSSPGDFNQALMELGALVCTPRLPQCQACPIAAHCSARLSGRVEELPKAAVKREATEVHMVSLVGTSARGVLMGKRSAEGLFGGLWEPPLWEGPAEEMLSWVRQQGGELSSVERVGKVVHVLTHRRLHVEVIASTLRSSPKALPPYQALAWVNPLEISDGPAVSTLTRKILRRAEARLCKLAACEQSPQNVDCNPSKRSRSRPASSPGRSRPSPKSPRTRPKS